MGLAAPLTDEEYFLLDPEAEPSFENVNPGTVTVEGFGVECWDFENKKPRNARILVNVSNLPVISTSKLLRRLDELQKSGVFGKTPIEDELNLKEIVGELR